MNFTSILMQWFEKNQRDLPWRHISDPYKIWLSEIILQQTRVQQGLSYYQKFTGRWPDVFSLSQASEDQVLALWQGLGYYSRARNLHHTAKNVVNNYNGFFPNSYEELQKLKGIGKYTAAAIASIAFNVPVPALDGNVTRVFARFLGIESPVDNPKTLKIIEDVAIQFIDRKKPGDFNQALMDFGSMVCKPASPECLNCPLREFCVAFKEGKTQELPLKSKKINKTIRYLNFFMIYNTDEKQLKFLVEKRTGNDVWKNLYQLPLLETESGNLVLELGNEKTKINIGGTTDEKSNQGFLNSFLQYLIDQGNDSSMWFSQKYTHNLTHQTLHACFHVVPLPTEIFNKISPRFNLLSPAEFDNLGKPVLIGKFLNWFYKAFALEDC